VAIDIIRERLERARRKTERAGIRNVSWVLAEAEEFLTALPDGFRINHRIFILFPDPWPKRRHWKNRLIQPGFLDRLAACAAPGTRLCFRTDHAPYFAAAVAMLKAHGAWSVQSPDQWPFEQRTVFEARAAMFESIVADRVRDWEPPKLTPE
jgi:tRNA (guanine-N7-)-methyltransferase